MNEYLLLYVLISLNQPVFSLQYCIVFSVSEEMVDELVRGCVQDMEMRGVIDDMIRNETM